MKTIKSILVLLFLAPAFAFSQTSTKIEAYYFHNKTRCTTCKTVEAEAKADLKELYGEKVTFQALNLEEKSTDAIAEKLKVSGQTLLVVKGDKQVNLTNEGFLYAVNDPAKFKKIIKEKVDPLVK
jgi:hypothetical protein